MSPPLPTIIYLHGFLSSPHAPKGMQTAEYFRRICPDVALIMPQLPDDLEAAITLLSTLIQQHPRCHFIGCSLGGFLATWATEQFGGKAVLINPVVHPTIMQAQFIGWHENTYTQTRFYIDEAVFAHLQVLEPAHITADRYWVFLQTGDEVLDYRLARTRYQHCQLTIEQGGDHGFTTYAQWLPRIAQFLCQ